MAVELVVLRDDARMKRHRREDPQALLHHRVEERKLRERRHRRRPATKDARELVAYGLCDARVLGEKEKRPRERIRARLVPRSEDDAGMSDELVFIERGPVFVARREEHREHVAPDLFVPLLVPLY